MFDSGYPLYVVKFLDNERILVGGGGGEGRHGIKNKLSLLKFTGSAAAPGVGQLAEVELSANEDAPTSVAIGTQAVYAGINRAEAARKAGKNTHLRVLDPETLEETASYNVFESTDPDVYQRAAAASSGYLAVAAAGGAKSQVVVLREDNLPSPAWSVQIDSDVTDLSFTSDGSHLAVTTEDVIFIYDSASGKVVKEVPAKAPAKWARSRFVTNTRLVGASHARSKGYAELIVYEIEDNVVEVHRGVLPGAKAVSGLDATTRRISVATPGGDVLIFDHRLSRLARLRAVHKLPVTGLAIDPEEGAVISISLDGSVNVARIPLQPNTELLSPATIGWVLASGLVVALLAYLSTFLIEYELLPSLRHDEAFGLVALLGLADYINRQSQEPVAVPVASGPAGTLGTLETEPATEEADVTVATTEVVTPHETDEASTQAEPAEPAVEVPEEDFVNVAEETEGPDSDDDSTEETKQEL